MSTQQPTIIYTLTDEAPRLATASFLPIVRAFAAQAGADQHPYGLCKADEPSADKADQSHGSGR